MKIFFGTSVNVGRLRVALAWELILVFMVSSAAFASTPSFISQFGSDRYDTGYEVATDSDGNIFIAGDTQGNLDGIPAAGSLDGYLRKMDSGGNWIWTVTFGTKSYEEIRGLAVDQDGNAYVAGTTSGSLVSSFGRYDIFVAKVSPDGEILWLDQRGTRYEEYGQRVALDDEGNLYVCGWTAGNMGDRGSSPLGFREALIMKYSPDGNRVWTHQFNNYYGDNYAYGVTVYDGKVYITGMNRLAGICSMTLGNLFLYAFDLNGNKLWGKSMGPQDTSGTSVAVNADGIYVSGTTRSSFDGNTFCGGSRNAIAVKFDLDGNRLWSRQWGFGYQDEGNDIALDFEGNVYVTGSTYGSEAYGTLDDQESLGGFDAYISKFTPEGEKLYTNLISTANVDYGKSIFIDPSGNILAAGLTSGEFPSQTSRGTDAWVIVYPSDNPIKINTPPVVNLLSTGGRYAQGIAVTLAGTGWDEDDGAVPSLVWISTIDGEIGAGEQISVSDLSTGTHTITLTATDSEGASVSESMTITIYALGDTTAMITVLREETDDPVIGAEVTIEDKKGNIQQATTNYDGIVIFTLFKAGKVDIFTEKAGLESVATPDRLVINRGAKNSVVTYMYDPSN